MDTTVSVVSDISECSAVSAMEVEQAGTVIQGMKEDPLQDLQEEPPLKKVCTGHPVPSCPPAPAPLGLPGDCHQTRHPLAASLVADKYLILEQLDGSSLYSCVNVHTQEDLVCKVRLGFVTLEDILIFE